MPMSDLAGVLFDSRPSVFDGERDVSRRTRFGERECDVIVSRGTGKRLDGK